MLTMLRDGTKSLFTKIILFGLLALAMAGLVFTDVSGSFRSGVGSNVVVSVDEIDITTGEFDRAVQLTMRELPPSAQNVPKEIIVQTTLQREISGRLYNLAVREAGLRISDQMAAQEIKKVVDRYVTEEMDEKETLSRLLQSIGMSEAGYIEAVKQEIAIQELINGVKQSAIVPEQLLVDALRFKNETRKTEYLKLAYDKVGAIDPATEEELQEMYKLAEAAYVIPEYRNIQYLAITTDQVRDQVEITDEDVEMAYDEALDRYTTKDTREIAQAVFPSEEVAKKALAISKDSASLEKAVEKLAKDDGAFLPVEKLSEESLPEDAAELAFSAELNTIVGPIETPLGWHLMSIEGEQASYTRPLSEVREELRDELIKTQAADFLYELNNQLLDMIASGAPIEDIAKEMKAEIKETGLIAADKSRPEDAPLSFEVADLDNIVAKAYEMDAASNGDTIESSENGYILVKIKDVQERSVKPFETVKDDVKQRWETRAKFNKAQSQAKAIQSKITAGEKLSAIAKGLKLTTVKTDSFTRDDVDENLELDTGYIRKAFEMDKTGESIQLITNDGILVIALTEQSIPDADKIAGDEDYKAYEDGLLQAIQKDLIEQYRQQLVRKYDVQVNDHLLKKMYADTAQDGAL